MCLLTQCLNTRRWISYHTQLVELRDGVGFFQNKRISRKILRGFEVETKLQTSIPLTTVNMQKAL